MLGKLTDVHDSHGMQVTLELHKSGSADDGVIDLFREKLQSLISGELKNRSTLYVHRICLGENSVKLQLVEATKLETQIDGSRSLEENGKFTVLRIEVGAEAVPSGK